MSADFFDTNIFIYSQDETDAGKHETAERLIREGSETQRGVISYQVVQETLNVLTHKLSGRYPPEAARQFLKTVLVPLWRVYPSPMLYERALDVQQRYRFSFYDSLIVAAALEAGCTRLLTEDLQHGQRIEGLTVEDPFRS